MGARIASAYIKSYLNRTSTSPDSSYPYPAPYTGPESVEPVYHICVVTGCRVLLALRSNGQYHGLVGEAYMPGTTNGEAVQGWKGKGDRKLETLDLQ
jgi:hypothetical protein